MKETLDVWVIVPIEKPYLRFVVDKRHFRSEAGAAQYRRKGGADHVLNHVILQATLTMET